MLLDIYWWSEEEEQFHNYDRSSSKCIYSHCSPPRHGVSELQVAMLIPRWHESRAGVGMLGHICWLLKN